jgi:hypothetical protein
MYNFCKCARYMYLVMYLTCIPNVSWTPLGYMSKYMQTVKIHAFSSNITEHVRFIWDTSGYIKIHVSFQDTRRLHQDTSGYVSWQQPPPNSITNPEYFQCAQPQFTYPPGSLMGGPGAGRAIRPTPPASTNPRDTYPVCILHVSNMYLDYLLGYMNAACILHVSRVSPSYQIRLSLDAFEIHESHDCISDVSRMYLDHLCRYLYPKCILYVSCISDTYLSRVECSLSLKSV